MTFELNLQMFQALCDALAKTTALQAALLHVLVEKGVLTEADQVRVIALQSKYLTEIAQEAKRRQGETPEETLARSEREHPEFAAVLRALGEASA